MNELMKATNKEAAMQNFKALRRRFFKVYPDVKMVYQSTTSSFCACQTGTSSRIETRCSFS